MTTDFAKAINKKFKKTIVFKASDPRFKINFIPTGILPLDILMKGGVPIGFWTEIYGDEAVLKTAIGLWTIANAQKMGMKALIIDPEDAMSKDILKLRGVDISPSALEIVCEFDNAEEALDVIKFSMEQKYHGIAMIDSISALLPKREAEGDMGTQQIGSGGLLTSKMGRVLTSANKRHMALILINQTRLKIGGFGDPTTKSGGKAPGFYDAQQLRLIAINRDRESKTGDKAKTGNRHITSMEIAAILNKSKVGGYNGDETTFTYDVLNNRINDAADIVTQGQIHGILVKRGNKLYYKDRSYFKKDLISALDKKPKLSKQIKDKIIKKAIKDE